MRCPLLAAVVVILALPVGLALAAQPEAQCEDCQPAPKPPNMLKRAWISVCRDFKRSNAWPDPFVTADRVAVRAPFDTMVVNGWRLQNTLSDHHFEDDSDRLTEAGRLKVAAIINHTPISYRAVFILRTQDPALTADRVASVQQETARILGDRPPVPIFETYEKPPTAAANYIDAVNQKYQSSIPDPRIPMDDEGSSTQAGSLPM